MTDSVAALIAEGKQRHAQDQLTEASRLYQQVLAADSGNVEASHMLGLVHFQQGELEVAESLIRAAIDADDGSSRMHCNLGAVLMAAQRYNEAHASFESALSRDRTDHDARYNLGLAAQALGRYGEAIEHYHRVLAEQPDSIDVQLNLGTAYRDAGKLEASESVYTGLLAKTPRLLPAHYNLGLTLKCGAQWQLAASAFRRCLELDAGFSDGLYSLATTLIDAGDAVAAIEEYTVLREALPDLPLLHFTFGKVLHDLGSHDEAVKALEAALAQDPDNSEARHALGLAELQRGNAAAALAAFEHNLKSRPAASRELAHKVTALAMLGRAEQVVALADTEKLIAVYHPPEPPGSEGSTGFTQALADFISAHPSLRRSPPGAFTEKGSLLTELLDDPEREPVVSLVRLLEASVDKFLQTHPYETEHPTLALRPDRKQLMAMGQVLSGSGRQRPHIQAGAWLSGIFYLKVPAAVREDDAGHAGWLQLGGSDGNFALKTPPESRWVCPENGKLVLFPAWFYQQSLPLPEGESCISVAFNVVPAKAEQKFT